MIPNSLSEEALHAIVETYRYFDVRFSISSLTSEQFFYVVGYLGKVHHFFGEGDDLCRTDSMSYAWTLVYLLRACKSGQDLHQELHRLGISCPIPASVIRKDGDFHG
ncbi:MAG: hypothetical protein K2H41_14045 [Acetatifactor sp.]|nr:hypothetical protein [Acetatifactor sp.]